jgi:hypothetical protein
LKIASSTPASAASSARSSSIATTSSWVRPVMATEKAPTTSSIGTSNVSSTMMTKPSSRACVGFAMVSPLVIDPQLLRK